MRITQGHKREDVSEIIRISDECYTGSERPPHDIMRAMLQVCDTFLAKEEGKLIGFAMVELKTISANAPQEPYIYSIAVSEDFQARGVGGNLLREIIKYYYLQDPAPKNLSLHVHVDNPAQKLYFDYGWRAHEVVRDYYGNDDEPKKDGLLMKRVL